jgi:hypothetical protein
MNPTAPSFQGTHGAAAMLAALLVLGAWLPPDAAAAPASSKPMIVSATVAKRATLKVIAQPASLVVTQADLDRGYVDAESPVQVAVQCNSAAGYLMVVENTGNLVSGASIRGLGAAVQLAASGVIPLPSTGAGGASHSLSFRFLLSGSAGPGRYAWPVHISAMPM